MVCKKCGELDKCDVCDRETCGECTEVSECEDCGRQACGACVPDCTLTCYKCDIRLCDECHENRGVPHKCPQCYSCHCDKCLPEAVIESKGTDKFCNMCAARAAPDLEEEIIRLRREFHAVMKDGR